MAASHPEGQAPECFPSSFDKASMVAKLNARLAASKAKTASSSPPAEVPAVAPDVVASARKTSNSRGPGQEGTVYRPRGRLVRCDDCQKVTHAFVLPGRHSPHWRDGVLVNCRGRAL